MTAETLDVVVAGGGVVGLATALAIRKGGTVPCRVAVRDASLASAAAPSLRAVAVAPGVRRFLERLGAWQAVAAGAQPIRRMVLTDSRVGAVPPPAFLAFEGEAAEPGEAVAHMVLQEPLHAALRAACEGSGVRLLAGGVREVRPAGDVVLLDAGTPDATRARLVVAADGARSRLREGAGLRSVGRDYDQSAIVATLRHAAPHEGIATQHFLPGGPLALLPLRDPEGGERRTSIVWTERRGEAERLAALPPAGFVAALEARIGPALGPMHLEDRPRALPLAVRLARELVGARLALAGDAARVIHPLAGQGLNLGLRDAEALGRLVAEAVGLGLDPGSPALLARYQRERRADGVALAATTHILNRLFSNDSGPLRILRDVGLGLVDGTPALKRLLARGAAAGVFASPARARDD